MQLSPLAFYAGPDQVMGVTSGIAGAIGVLLMFWNRIVGAFHKMMNKFRGSSAESTPPAPKENSTPQA